MQPTYIRLSKLASRRQGEKEHIGLLPVSPAQIWRWVRAGTFPQPVKLGPNLTAWRAADVQAWLESRSVNEVQP